MRAPCHQRAVQAAQLGPRLQRKLPHLQQAGGARRLLLLVRLCLLLLLLLLLLQHQPGPLHRSSQWVGLAVRGSG